jgi:hypothetical protein
VLIFNDISQNLNIMSTQESASTWKVWARTLKPSTNSEYVDREIELPEYESNLQMRETPCKPVSVLRGQEKSIFGMPINTEMAVRLIGNSRNLSNQFVEKSKQFLDIEQLDFLKKVQFLNYGITFDRSIVLRILSQPNCEGLRAYLCAKPFNEKLHTSIVLVGVDANGFDLNYAIDDTKDGEDDQSLIAEYGFPPDSGDGEPFNLEKLLNDPPKQYVLLNKALKIKVNE